MSVLYFGKTEPQHSRAEHESITADGAPPGVYTPNMSRQDARRWRAKHVGGENERIEIRHQVRGVNLVLIVFKAGAIHLSANGRVEFDAAQAQAFLTAIQEAQGILDSQ